VRSFKKLAYTDSLTKLPNRAALSRQLREAVSQATRNSRLTAVIFFDLDNFKTINDRLGHTVGDQVLASAAARLAAGIRDGDTVARFGGDEFIVVANNIHHLTDAHLVYRRLASRLTKPYIVGGQQIRVAASAGIAVMSHRIATPHQLLEHADAALYRAKAAGPGAMRIANATQP